MSTSKIKFETLQVHAGHNPDKDTLSGLCLFIRPLHICLKVHRMPQIFSISRVREYLYKDNEPYNRCIREKSGLPWKEE